MYVYTLAVIYTYTYILNAIFVSKNNNNKKKIEEDRSLFMQGVRAVKYKKYKLVLVLMRGRSYTDFPSHFPLCLHRWADSFLHWLGKSSESK